MANLGESLKLEREKRQISLEDIAEKTRLNFKLLQSLEKNDLHLLPGGFYQKSIVRNYLKILGLDEKEFHRTYQTEPANLVDQKPEIADKYLSKLRYSRFKQQNVLFTFCTIFLLISLAVVFAYINKTTLREGWDYFFPAVALPETTMPRFDAYPPYSLDRSPVNVSVDFLENCWAQMRQGRGEPVSRVFQKGERLDMKGYEFSFTIAKPSAVIISLNGRDISYLKTLSRPEKIDINPQTLGFLLGK
jgi:cytoskeletal protein RodZ